MGIASAPEPRLILTHHLPVVASYSRAPSLTSLVFSSYWPNGTLSKPAATAREPTHDRLRRQARNPTTPRACLTELPCRSGRPKAPALPRASLGKALPPRQSSERGREPIPLDSRASLRSWRHLSLSAVTVRRRGGTHQVRPKTSIHDDAGDDRRSSGASPRARPPDGRERAGAQRSARSGQRARRTFGAWAFRREAHA